jgi:uncharacterized membrane protein YqjE
MPTPATEQHGVGTAAKDVADHAKALVGLELELAQLELKRKAGALGAGAVLGLAAALFGLFAFAFLLATVAAALATTLDVWLALLIVGVVLLVLAGLNAVFALSAFKKGSPPVPEQAIEEARLTGEKLRSNGRA